MDLRYMHGSDSAGEEEEVDPDEEFPLKLPKEIAKLGKKGMQISCMNLKYRNGVWSVQISMTMPQFVPMSILQGTEKLIYYVSVNY